MKIVRIIFLAICLSTNALAQSASDFLITTDIGPYKKMTQGGASGSVLAGAGHFRPDHRDVAFGIAYVNDEKKMWIDVQVTQHYGSDSDMWLLHEMDVDFRNYYGIPGGSYAVVPIDGNYVLEFGSAGWDYRWLSGNKVIKIDYRDPQMTKPEPLEVVKAYLAKHPSTIPTMTLSQLRSTENKTKWIKDEMERRLWLGDKWAASIQTSDSKLRDKLKSMTDSMVVFLNYREKYYGISAKNDKIALETALFQNNISAIQTKLTEYKTWWAAHKADTISLP